VNPTIRKFGHPATVIADYTHWVVLLRPAQPTLGSLVLAAKSDATAFADLSVEAFAELPQVIAAIEGVLAGAVAYQRINYLMLMMVDPNVHFHVIPRYDGSRAAEGIALADSGWPGVPALGDARALDPDETARMVRWLQVEWPSAG
jgi:diadenosine tetraphosphate (Ap4A) HIT family hydrolase